MNWNLEGLRVSGQYMGEFSVTGRVELSRVKYGGGVTHHVVLDTPVNVYGALRDRVILEHELVEQVSSNGIVNHDNGDINDNWYDEQYEAE